MNFCKLLKGLLIGQDIILTAFVFCHSAKQLRDSHSPMKLARLRENDWPNVTQVASALLV